MQTTLGNLFRHFADMADAGECGVDAVTLQKVAELHLLDHQRINMLQDAVRELIDEKKKCLKVKLHPHPNGKKI